MSDFVATHVIQTGTRRHYVRACALNGGPDTLDNPRGVVLYTPEEWDAAANADWTYDPKEGLRFQSSTAHPMLQCEVTIQPFADCCWTRVDGWNDDGTRVS